MHLLDTDTLTHLHAGHSRVVQCLRELEDPEVGTTIITRIEMLRGRMDFVLKAATGSELIRAQELLARTEQFLNGILTVPLNEDAAELFDELRVRKGLKKFGRADLLIASIVLAHRAVLVTRNVRHFQPIPQLQVVNWVD